MLIRKEDFLLSMIRVSPLFFFYLKSTIRLEFATMAESVDALDSGSSELWLVEVQVFLVACGFYPQEKPETLQISLR